MEPQEPQEWYELSEYDRYMVALKVACPLCMAQYYRDCQPHGGEGRVPSRYSFTGMIAMHVEREMRAKTTYQAELLRHRAAKRRAEQQQAGEVSRTCPWCGTLYDTVILMEEHEVDCE